MKNDFFYKKTKNKNYSPKIIKILLELASNTPTCILSQFFKNRQNFFLLKIPEENEKKKKLTIINKVNCQRYRLY